LYLPVAVISVNGRKQNTNMPQIKIYPRLNKSIKNDAGYLIEVVLETENARDFIPANLYVTDDDFAVIMHMDLFPHSETHRFLAAELLGRIFDVYQSLLGQHSYQKSQLLQSLLAGKQQKTDVGIQVPIHARVSCRHAMVYEHITTVNN
jgi:hypothetical protein